jgi:hypothetical protein
MGFSFRKSVNIGPFRVSASRSGIGYSVGGRGFRVGKNARGRKYHSFSIPGTGVSYRGSGAKGCGFLLMILVTVVLLAGTLIAKGTR